MRRSAYATAALLAAAASIAAGCGGEAATTPEASTTSTETVGTSTDAAGRAVFLGVAGCGACHTLADAGTDGTVASNLDEKAPTADRVRDVVTNGSGAMPSYRKQLTAQQIGDVAAYVAAVAGRRGSS